MVRVCALSCVAAVLLACGNDGDTAAGDASSSGAASGCPTAAPLTGSFDGEIFSPTATNARVMYWAISQTDAVLVTASDHALDCTPSGGLPPETWMEIDIRIPKPSQKVAVFDLDPSLGADGDRPGVGAGRYVYLPEGGISNHIVAGISGTLCLSAFDDAHVAGRIEVHEEKVQLSGEFQADVCAVPADAGP